MSAFDRMTGQLTIDVGAVVANWRTIQSHVGPNVQAAAVVKADAYGLGMDPIAPALARAGCRTFFVATIDEGIALRRLCRKARILVLCGPLPGSAAEFHQHDLCPVLNSLDQIGLWAGYAAAIGSRLDCALHLDTGMTRLGLDVADIKTLQADADMLNGLNVMVVMSHMACADETAHPLNGQQLQLFQHLSQDFSATVQRSLAASSAVFLGSAHHQDLVRPGAALYGINPVPGQPNPMQPVVHLEAKILQVRDVDSPQTVGYGATHPVSGPGRLATVAAGYADGLHRMLGNRGYGILGGVRVPVVGRISMDLTTFDVSAVPRPLAFPGASIQLIGADHPVDELAAEAGTIGYEILTSLGQRYGRVYLDGTV